MSRYIKYFFLITVIFCFIFLSFHYLRSQQIEETLEYLMNERINIIEDTAYGNVSYQEAEKQLRQVIDNPLLKSDLLTLQNLKSSPTSIDRVKDFEINKIDHLSISHDYVTLSANILWTLEGPQGTYYETIMYQFKLNKDNKDRYLLYDYYPIE